MIILWVLFYFIWLFNFLHIDIIDLYTNLNIKFWYKSFEVCNKTEFCDCSISSKKQAKYMIKIYQALKFKVLSIFLNLLLSTFMYLIKYNQFIATG